MSQQRLESLATIGAVPEQPFLKRCQIRVKF